MAARVVAHVCVSRLVVEGVPRVVIRLCVRVSHSGVRQERLGRLWDLGQLHHVSGSDVKRGDGNWSHCVYICV